MTFEEVVDQASAMLQRRGRVTYRLLKRQFHLDDEALEDLKEEIIYGQKLAVDEDGRVLVWIGAGGQLAAQPSSTPPSAPAPDTQEASPSQMSPTPVGLQPIEAERRQLSVLFCDLVDSTALSSQLDPEEWREVVRAYQDTCAKVIARFEGHIAQYLGDGLLVYFSYPLAHEDDAQRAMRAGLGMVEAIGQLNTRLARERGVHLAVRLGVHTGLVVVGDVGGGTRQEQLALGETPNIAARLQGIAVPNTLVISAATFQLLGGFFACQSLGPHLLKGITQPIEVYQVHHERMARSRLEAAGRSGLTPLVGREPEVALLRERWAQVKDGLGQAVLLSGEAGIGKSRLVQILTEQVASEPLAWLTPCQCSPYYQNTALYPMIELLERVVLRFEREESAPQKLSKLEGFVVQYGLPLAETVPLFASFLSIPLGADYASLELSPEQQKQKTLHALLTILLKIAAQQPVLFVMEDLHWVDPTTLEFLSLLVDQGPTDRLLVLLTFRPDFSPPWTGRSHLTQITLPRLPRRQTTEMMDRVAHGKALPPEVVTQVVARTDGVPLFVEELTKMVLESGLLQEQEDRYALTGPLPPLAIPTTLHDSLMARLDRLAAVKGLAQLGAMLGREFSYELLRAVAPWGEGLVHQGLHQLVAAEFLYQRGLPPQVTYVFKHALIQEAAYQSMLRSTRQQYHQRIAEVLEAQFPEIAEMQPELVAHHCTEAGLGEQAVEYWLRSGARSLAQSAHAEAIAHLTKGLDVLQTLPDTPSRTQHELDFQTTLGRALAIVRGHAAPETAHAYARARELCRHGGDPVRLFDIQVGLREFYLNRGELRTARELAEACLALAQGQQDPASLMRAHFGLGSVLYSLGDFAQGRDHLEQALALYTPHQDRALTGQAPLGVPCLARLAATLWKLGYPRQALARNRDMLHLAHELSDTYNLVRARCYAAEFHHLLRDGATAQEQAEAALSLSTEQAFTQWVGAGMFWRGWGLAAQGQGEEGITAMRQGLGTRQAAGSVNSRPTWLALLAEAHGGIGQVEEGLHLLAEARALAKDREARSYEAEMDRLQGELLLKQEAPDARQAEADFHHALEVACQQQAKSLELRAAISLSRLWQQQGKRAEAYELLAPVYGWFTEGFDTTDLQEAKALLEELS